MQVFGKFTIVSCLVLLTWRQAELQIAWEAGTGILAVIAAAAAILTCKSRRSGYWMAVLLGLGCLTELFLVVDPVGRLVYLQPLLLWGGALIVCGAMLLWSSRERKKAKPVYERHADYY